MLRTRLPDVRPTGPAEVLARARPALTLATLAVLFLIAVAAALFIGRSESGWTISDPDSLVFSFRWPRVLTAAAAGLALASAGVMLQRLLRNPLASPEIVGISAGAGFAVALGTIITSSAITDPPPLSILGSLSALTLLLLMLQRRTQSTLAVVLAGIALAAALDAGMGFAISVGGDEVYTLLGWLSGTTLYADAGSSPTLLLLVLVLFAASTALGRWLDLIALGPEIASGRGLNLRLSQPLLFLLA
ncbi:MAG: iron chelate uptake ABC transporter family permease subunit, partial [Pseudomonadota bacterium]